MSMVFSLPFLVGVAAAAIFAGLMSLLDSKRAQQLYAAGLLTAALIYVGFAALNHGTARLGLELSGLLIFGLLSVLGARRWPLVLGLAWLAHGTWDFWHNAHPAAYVPSWWPGFCVGFDWFIGIFILATLVRKKSLVKAPAKYS